jgi:PTS system mannose-specific IIA component
VIGVIIVTHGRLGDELHKTAKLIIGDRDGPGDRERCRTVAIEMDLNPDHLRALIAKAVKDQDGGRGVLILTDMFGGTPSNISLSFLEEGRVEVLTGVSLPMLLRAFQLQEKPSMTLAEMAESVLQYSHKSVVIASRLLAKRTR